MHLKVNIKMKKIKGSVKIKATLHPCIGKTSENEHKGG